MALSGSFSYVFIPANEEAPVELHQGDKSGGLSNDVLIRTAKEYFHQQTGGNARAEALNTASPEERKTLAQQIRSQITAENPNAKNQLEQMEDDALIELIRSTQASPSCEILALTVPTKGNQYYAVSMYGADDAGRHGGSINRRATALMEASGHAPPQGNPDLPPGVYGDVFVGRCLDKEESDVWERVDFSISDAVPSADWCKIARTRGGGGGSGTTSPASLSGVMTQALAGNNNGPPLTASSTTITSPGTTKNDSTGWTWNQTDDEVELKFSVASGTKAKYVKVQFGRNSLKVTVAGQTLVNGSTGGLVVVDDCTYTIQDDDSGKRELCVTLGKKGSGTIWPFAVQVST